MATGEYRNNGPLYTAMLVSLISSNKGTSCYHAVSLRTPEHVILPTNGASVPTTRIRLAVLADGCSYPRYELLCSGTRSKTMSLTSAESVNRCTLQITHFSLNTIQHAYSKRKCQ